jgi:hypothetical protein
VTEHLIQKAIVDYCDHFLPKTVQVIAVSNKPRSAIQGNLEKQRGARKGFPDLILIKAGGICGLLEIKAEGGSLSKEQREWRDWCGENQVPYAVIRSLDDLIETLADWRVGRKAA